MKIVYHWFPPGAHLDSRRVCDDSPVIYEYACGQLGSPYYGPHQMHQLRPRVAQWDGMQQRVLKRDGVLNETNCPGCKKVWDENDAKHGDAMDFQMRLKLFREVTERKTLVDFISAKRITESSYLTQQGEENPY
ncbi:MAG: hypothetical protein EPN91_08140 [Salinibacterium sp.]|nr:MAG: hypothetical protein EPN91_08140 [Salinibacterium sp.]